MAKKQIIPIKDSFSKWLIDWHGRNKLPTNFASYIRNARIENKAITIRKWSNTLIEDATWTHIRWITANATQGKILCASNSKLREVNLTAKTLDDIWSIWTDADVTIFNHGKYTIILTGIGKPYVYDGNTLFQLWSSSYLSAYLTSWDAPTTVLATWTAVTDWTFTITIDWVARNITWLNFSIATSMSWIASIIQAKIRTVTSWKETVIFNNNNKFVISSAIHTVSSAITVTSATGSWTDISWAWATAFLDCETWRWTVTASAVINAPEINPIIGTAYSWFTVIAGNTDATNNFIYFSRPVVPTNPERAFDWIWSLSENRNMQSKILWLCSSLNNLFIFTQNTIEYVGKDSLASIWSTFSFYSSPIGDWDQLLNRNCVASANDKVFYLTKDFTIKSLNYVQGTIDPAIWQLSDRPLLSIKNFLETQLNDTQTSAFCIRKDDKIEWHLRSYNSVINDIVVVYDITNDSWLIDNDKFYSCMVKYDAKYYAWSYLNSNIILDDFEYSNDIIWIPFRYDTVAVSFGNPLLRKFLDDGLYHER